MRYSPDSRWIALNLVIFAFFIFCIIGCEPLGDSVQLTDKPLTPARNYVCQDAEVETIAGYFEENFRPPTAPGKTFDAHEAEFLNKDVRWGMITIKAEPEDIGMCWNGGWVYTDKPWDASWDEHKDLDGPTRNSTAIDIFSTDMTVSGLHFFNVHDGVRLSEADNWSVEHNWGEYVRDDCIENDYLHSGRVFNSLFDGCYTGISTRPTEDDDESDGAGSLVQLDQVLLRLQAMPYSYNWDSKEDVVDECGDPYTGTGIPYGHGDFFKLTDVERNPHFSIKNSTFLAVHLTKGSKFDFPPERLMDECENNTIIWLGPGEYPGELPTGKFPGCFEIVTGQEGHDLWRQLVTDWHARHQNVGANRKPTSPGDLVFPRVF